MRERVKSLIAYGMPAFIVLVLMSFILLIQGIWPFGGETVDFYDMAQQLASEYLQIHDEIHGVKSLVFDWYTCLSRGIPGATCIALSNLLYYFVPRDMILETFSIMLIFKTMCMAISMRVFLKKEISSCPDFYSIILSAGYGMCGFVFMQYTIISWLDVAMLVPLIMMFTQQLLRDGKIKGYVICLSLTFLTGFYLPVVILLFIFIMTGFYLLAFRTKRSAEREDVDKNTNCSPYILRLGFATVLSMMFSAWTLIPKVLGSAGSMRFENEAESGIIAQYVKILTHVLPDYSSRWWCLLGVSFAAAVAIVGMILDLKNRNFKRLIFVTGGFSILLLELVFENIMLIWHFGSYVNYPTRNGFLMYLVFATVAAAYAKEVLKENETGAPRILVMSVIIVSILLCAVGLFWYTTNEGMSFYTVFRVSMVCVMACFCVYLFLILFRKGMYAKLAVFLISAELVFYGVMLIGKPLYITGYSEEPEQEGEYIRIVNELNMQMDIPSSRLDRIKNPDTSLNTNYGGFMKRATLTGWPSSLSGDVVNSAYKMGNSIQYTRILDAGGNAFTDALLHTTQVISLKEQDPKLYNKTVSSCAVIDHKTKEEREYALYDCRYILPFGTIALSENALSKISHADNAIDFSNAAYRAISGTDSDIAEVINPVEYDTDLQIDISGDKLLYFTVNCGDHEEGNLRIYVNGRSIPVPTLKNPDNLCYPAHFNNNCLYLGAYSDETVNVRIDNDESIDAPSWEPLLYTIDVMKLDEICRSYAEGIRNVHFEAGTRTLNGVATGNAGEFLMLPIEYNEDWTVYVNNQVVKPLRVTGLFMAIPLADGDNQISMSYFPSTMKMGIIISLLTVGVLVLLFLWYQICRKKNASVKAYKPVECYDAFEKKISKFVRCMYMVGWSAVMLAMYICTSLYGLYYYIKMFIG